MSISNGKSRQTLTRVPHKHHDHLIAKAKVNPSNKRKAVAFEINVLIKSDYEKAQAKRKKK